MIRVFKFQGFILYWKILNLAVFIDRIVESCLKKYIWNSSLFYFLYLKFLTLSSFNIYPLE